MNKMPKSKFKIDEITLVLIVALLAMIISLNNRVDDSISNQPPEMEAEKIVNIILDEQTVSFASNGVINEDKLNAIRNMDYHDFKNHLGAKNDFCIYIEDENGNIILAKGSNKLSGDGIYCEE